MKKRLLLLLLPLMSYMPLQHVMCQTKPMELPLYTNQIPNEVPGPDEEASSTDGGFLRISKVRKPMLSVYLPPAGKATGTAVLICPGGGYSILAAAHEGADVARKFNEQGIAAFVLKYRLPDEKTSSHPEIAPLQDAQQGLLLIRQHAKEWKVNPDKVGIMGFSAGGHLASTAGTHFQHSYIDNPDSVSLRPDFMLLIYPVISSDTTFAHRGSFEKLLGKNASEEQMQEFSNETQITDQTPPTFLVHAKDDQAVPVKNSQVFYDTLLQHHVPAEIFLYEKGGHGFGLTNKTTSVTWFDKAVNWMKRQNF